MRRDELGFFSLLAVRALEPVGWVCVHQELLSPIYIGLLDDVRPLTSRRREFAGMHRKEYMNECMSRII